ncbi:hypothetical protein B0H14DRAFT_2621067 [Mycena olivaceomarginata]|nr:hypothetical protein B0H14DRAFT_2621067 [Mycena olivaceomarginata]
MWRSLQEYNLCHADLHSMVCVSDVSLASSSLTVPCRSSQLDLDHGDTNVKAFMIALILKHPFLMLSSRTRTQEARAELVAAICIVAEQTFTESAATSNTLWRVGFLTLKAYLGSDLERDVKGYFARDELDKLVEIIRTNRLRINAGLTGTPSALKKLALKFGITGWLDKARS